MMRLTSAPERLAPGRCSAAIHCGPWMQVRTTTYCGQGRSSPMSTATTGPRSWPTSVTALPQVGRLCSRLTANYRSRSWQVSRLLLPSLDPSSATTDYREEVAPWRRSQSERALPSSGIRGQRTFLGASAFRRLTGSEGPSPRSVAWSSSAMWPVAGSTITTFGPSHVPPLNLQRGDGYSVDIGPRRSRYQLMAARPLRARRGGQRSDGQKRYPRR